MSRFTALVLLGAAACASEPPLGAPRDKPAPRSEAPQSASVGLPGVALDGNLLSGRAFAAEAAFLFPAESRALAHSLLRSEFARLEAQRLGLSVDQQAVQAALSASVADLRQQTEGDLEAWARQRYGQAWERVELGLEQRIADNQLYQQVARSWSQQQGEVRLRMLTTREPNLAHDWARRIANGASAATMAQGSLDPGPNGDGSMPWLPAHLAPHQLAELEGRQLASKTDDWELGEVYGPFQFDGEAVWRLIQVLETRPPRASAMPRQALLAELQQRPISPLEERAWFAAMLARYNAREGLPAFETPSEVFVRARTR